LDHETTAPLLSDLLAGRLAPDRSGEAWSHVGTCPDCRSVTTTMHQVRQAAAGYRGTAWGEHPRAEDLVDYALDDDELSGTARAQVDDHLRTCRSCLRHIKLTREAHLSVLSQAGGTRFADRLFSPTLAWAAALVMIALLGGLALPAYRGLVALPEAQRARQDLAREMRSLRHEERVLRDALQAHEEERSRLQSGGGAVPLLYLGDTARGPGASPSVALRSGQLFQPIVLDTELALSSQQEVALALRRLPDGAEAWSHRATWGQLWDPDSRALTLLVPTAVLSPGEYRLDLRQPGRTQPLFAARFWVRPAARRSP
jgi:hypothetical protein